MENISEEYINYIKNVIKQTYPSVSDEEAEQIFNMAIEISNGEGISYRELMMESIRGMSKEKIDQVMSGKLTASIEKVMNSIHDKEIHQSQVEPIIDSKTFEHVQKCIKNN